MSDSDKKEGSQQVQSKQADDDQELLEFMYSYTQDKETLKGATLRQFAGKAHIGLTFGKNCPIVGEKTSLTRSYLVDGEGKSMELGAGPSAAVDAESWSEDGKLCVRARTVKEKLYVEVWTDQMHLFTLNASEKFELVCNNTVFGGMSWSPGNKKVVFVAERKAPKEKKLGDVFEGKPEERAKKASEFFDGFAWKQSFGETMDNLFYPEIWILDIEARKLSKVLNAEVEGRCAAYPVFLGEDKLIFHSFSHDPFVLGQNFCINRPHRLEYLSCISTESPAGEGPKCLTPGLFSAFAPRLTEDGRIIFFGRRKHNPGHISYSALLALRIADLENPEPEIETLEPEVDDKRADFVGLPVSHDAFRSAGLLRDSKNREFFVCATATKGARAVFVFSLAERRSFILPTETPFDSLTLIAVHAKLGALFGSAGPNRPGRIVFRLAGNFEESTFTQVFEVGAGGLGPAVQAHFAALQSTEHEDIFLASGAHARLFGAKGAQEQPLVTLIHGGPHGMAALLPAAQFDEGLLLARGYAVLIPNYRGSLGYGQSFADSLIGHCGTKDVEDLIEFIEKATASSRVSVDPKRVAVAGFSHGGFLSCWMAAKPAPRLKCWAAFNPVTDFVSMAAASDIPDWSFDEAQGGPFEFKFPPSAEALLGMVKSSPVYQAGNVETPGLICLGDKDLRVVPSNGKYFYKTLKQLGKNVEVKVYPKDGHPLASIEAWTHHMTTLLRFLKKNL